ncbi:urease accessory protein UreF [Stenoxybacter acetivorans]|uniref:urease accessory protein UreF n=1 Tax=Stenoxybacter acetivorans TaxID=422441 RepID=UPI0005664E89|nr:urease accessory protein UreF [Stenoxybacter acetivorans]
MNAAALAQWGQLLQLADPTLPIGGFNHSGGLETFVQQRAVHDADTLRALVYTQLQHNWLHNDGAYVSLAFDAAAAQDLPALLKLDERIGAAKAPRELRESSFKLGVRLLKIFARQPLPQLAADFQAAIAAQQAQGFYPLVFGLLAAALGLDKAHSLYAFYYNAAVGLVTNGVKLIPLSQMVGQDILLALHEPIARAAAASIVPVQTHIGAAAPATDIRAMQHEHLYTRLYMS